MSTGQCTASSRALRARRSARRPQSQLRFRRSAARLHPPASPGGGRAPGEEDFGCGLVTGIRFTTIPYDPIRSTLLIRYVCECILSTTTHSNPLCARALNIKSLPGSPLTQWPAICTRSSSFLAPGFFWPLPAGAAAERQRQVRKHGSARPQQRWRRLARARICEAHARPQSIRVQSIWRSAARI